MWHRLKRAALDPPQLLTAKPYDKMLPLHSTHEKMRKLYQPVSSRNDSFRSLLQLQIILRASR